MSTGITDNMANQLRNLQTENAFISGGNQDWDIQYTFTLTSRVDNTTHVSRSRARVDDRSMIVHLREGWVEENGKTAQGVRKYTITEKGRQAYAQWKKRANARVEREKRRTQNGTDKRREIGDR